MAKFVKFPAQWRAGCERGEVFHLNVDHIIIISPNNRVIGFERTELKLSHGGVVSIVAKYEDVIRFLSSQ